MSTPHAQERLEAIFEEVKVAFPYYDEDKQAEIAMKRFDEELVWPQASNNSWEFLEDYTYSLDFLQYLLTPTNTHHLEDAINLIYHG